MSDFDEMLGSFTGQLRNQGYALRPTAVPGVAGAVVKCVFSSPVFDNPIVAIPDVHLGDGSAGDIFLAGSNDAVSRLVAVMTTLKNLLNQPGAEISAIQLGDWFDVWRAEGGDVQAAQFGAIQNVAAYRQILDLDAELGLAHIIGNHDASFLGALPDRRVTQPGLFRLGFWLGQKVYAMHGHQTDIAPPANLPSDQFFVAAATTMAEFVPGVTTFEAYADRFGNVDGVVQWLLSCFGLLRRDPGPQPRPPDTQALPTNVLEATLVLREARDDIARVAREVSALPQSNGRSASVVIVGHSHAPCVSVSRTTDSPTVILDAGSWTYGQGSVLIAAEDTAAVFDVVALG